MLEDIVYGQYPTSHADMNSFKGTKVNTKIKVHHEDAIRDAQHQTYISKTFFFFKYFADRASQYIYLLTPTNLMH